MPKFRRKTKVFEAEQFNLRNRPLPFQDNAVVCKSPEGEWYIDTPTGRTPIYNHDWVMKGENGVFDRVRPDDFERDYEPVEENKVENEFDMKKSIAEAKKRKDEAVKNLNAAYTERGRAAKRLSAAHIEHEEARAIDRSACEYYDRMLLLFKDAKEDLRVAEENQANIEKETE